MGVTRFRRVNSGAASISVFLIRRLFFGALTLLGTSIIGYALAIHLDRHPDGEVIGLRTYSRWLQGVFQGNWGMSTPGFPPSPTNPPVFDAIAAAIPQTLRLVGGAAVFALVLGVFAGVIAAVRQHSRIDYWFAALSFVLFSIPPFVAAYMMQLWGIIRINDWFSGFANNPLVPWYFIIVAALVIGLVWSEVIGGVAKKRRFVFGVATVATVLIGFVVTSTAWILHPQLGIVGVGVVSFAIALVVVALFTRIGDYRTLRATLITAAFMTVAWYPLQFIFASALIGWPVLVLIALAAVGCGVAIGWLNGGDGNERHTSMQAAGTTALFAILVIFADRFMQIWPHYLNLPHINNRPFPVLGVRPGIPQDFWFQTLDSWLFLLPPTIALGAISFASYMRYSRASLIEVLGKEYVQTARAKGLPEHTVLFRHALRNSLIPLATIVPLDLAGLVGGAILVEIIFGIPGMGAFYRASLFRAARLGMTFMYFNRFMGYLLVTGAFLVIANIISDLVYATLDPRIRLSLQKH